MQSCNPNPLCLLPYDCSWLPSARAPVRELVGVVGNSPRSSVLVGPSCSVGIVNAASPARRPLGGSPAVGQRVPAGVGGACGGAAGKLLLQLLCALQLGHLPCRFTVSSGWGRVRRQNSACAHGTMLPHHVRRSSQAMLPGSLVRNIPAWRRSPATTVQPLASPPTASVRLMTFLASWRRLTLPSSWCWCVPAGSGCSWQHQQAAQQTSD